jgi:hypothetical protein
MDKLEVYGKPSEALEKVITSFGARLSIILLDSVMNSYEFFYFITLIVK